MDKQNKKVICIRANEDKDYEQIIFVMKDENGTQIMKNKGRLNFVQEAEKIINEKLERSGIQKVQQNAVIKRDDTITQLIIKRSSTFDVALNICMLFGCLFLTAALVFLT